MTKASRDLTKQDFIEAFLLLCQEKGFSKVSVKDIVEKAGYNRSTFYYHYEGLDDLLDDIQDLLLEDLTDIDLQADFNQIIQDLVDKALHSRRHVLEILISEKGDPNFLDRLIQGLLPIIQDRFSVREDEPRLEYYVTYLIHSIFSVIILWIKNNKDLPLSQVEAMLVELLKTQEDQLNKLADEGVIQIQAKKAPKNKE